MTKEHPSLTPVRKKKEDELVTAFKKVEEKKKEYNETKQLRDRIVTKFAKEALSRLEPFVIDFSKLTEVQATLTDLINIMMSNAELEKEVLEKINARLEQEL